MTPKRPDWPAVFLKTLGDTCNVRLAAHAAGVSRTAAYNKREQDEAFRAAWEQALEDGCDLLEAEAYKRARSGSDTLMIFLLKSYRPTRFRETTRQEISGPNGGPIDFRPIADALDGKLALIAARVGANGVSEDALR